MQKETLVLSDKVVNIYVMKGKILLLGVLDQLRLG